jgi:DnaJ-class molecular chaperone
MSISSNVKIFFKGVTDSASLKKRYKEITKIYHPDNMNGDEELVKAINQEYEAQKRYFIGT